MAFTPAQLGTAMALQPGEDQLAQRGYGLPQWPTELKDQRAYQLQQLQRQLAKGQPLMPQMLQQAPVAWPGMPQQPQQQGFSASGLADILKGWGKSQGNYINSAGDFISGGQVTPG